MSCKSLHQVDTIKCLTCGWQPDVDFNPHNRAFTGGVGKPTKIRPNDGRQSPPSQMGLQYAASKLCRPFNYSKYDPYVNNSPVTRVVIRAPEHLTPKEKKRWHKLRKLGVI